MVPKFTIPLFRCIRFTCLAGFSSLKMTDEQLHILSDITHYGVYRSIPQKHDPLQTLVKCGYITTQDDQVYTFACPLIASFVQFFLYSRFSLKSQPTSLRDFILSSLPNFRQSMLQNTKSKNVDMKVSEKFWQSEFYYASTKELPYGTFISSEVGYLLNIYGTVDFLIDDNLNWAVEFLIETNSPSEHLQRFNLKGGKYSP